ncbi:hypothetical protein CNAG_02713 [Cryptococcus neoformans var. grubii H99]|uniref:Uncharacterized protein n=1 Tax=Cryptococcus neoformans (strain H99 / ATCC 208821 / CBS 10515 / FGSC 9487) TaxID=235443 RepID=J9VKM8_CRYN9|nr:hypothetical protein CNAG_02713 [Cryptococcus neoformans var. grubii H99]AFR93976.1 hypothetical protein CNAG_02713 [Cryptococcus neoformans var. grubii H99]AUB23572.1 hypothetical protein CKF44_02713 [Cryptococcus neoformans var. grubii]|eukprot:XP_012048086.1 hypothetical protein CNAG_02713 [Cryptococcus neoformans var. grubii H99]
MSTYYRRFGRFASASTSESHQRQLGAPVSKWKREWVAPEGLPAESSYKIFKWVRTDVKAQFSGIDEPSEAADYTPAPEGQGEDEGEVLEEDDEGIQEVDDEGDSPAVISSCSLAVNFENCIIVGVCELEYTSRVRGL